MKQVRIIITARYKVADSDSQVETVNAGEVILRDDAYADFLVSQGLAEFCNEDETAPETPLESPETNDGLKVVEIPPAEDIKPPGAIVAPVGANLERDGKIGKKTRRKQSQRSDMLKGKKMDTIFTIALLLVFLFLAVKPAAARTATKPAMNSLWRQGGDPVNWAEEGTINYAVTTYTEQLGTAITDGNGQVFVTFPVAFSGSPVLTYSVLGHVPVRMVAVGQTGVHFVANHDDGTPAAGVTIYWRATGQ